MKIVVLDGFTLNPGDLEWKSFESLGEIDVYERTPSSDLSEALRTGVIAGAAVDVLSSAPPPRDNPLLAEERCRITPHPAWATLAARRRLMRQAFENLSSFLQGDMINIVNGY